MKGVFALAFVAAEACAAFGSGLVANPHFDADRVARQEVMGRGFWIRGIGYKVDDVRYPGNRETGLQDLPVFNDRVPECGFGSRPVPKDYGYATWPKVADNIPGGTNSAAWKAFEATGSLPVPTFAGFWAKRTHQALVGEVKLDYDDFNAWIARHPNLVGIELLDEWVGDFHLTRAHRLPSYASDVERAYVTNRYYSHFSEGRPGILRDAHEYVRRKLELNYWATNHFAALTSNIMSADFMAAAWGAKCVEEEVTDTNMEGANWEMRWELPAFSCRGAARQFGIPWTWYVAIFKSGYTKDGRWEKETTCVQDPGGRDPTGGGMFRREGGLSPSLQRRGLFYGYLAGATFLQTEMARMQLFSIDREKKAEVLSDRGRAWVEVDAFARKHPDRGVPYTPVAILMPFDQGYGTHGGQGWYHNVSTYSEGDHMLDGVFYSVIPGRERDAEQRRGVEHCFHNVELPMMYDALVPDSPQDPEKFLAALKAYPAAILAGQYLGRGVAGFWPTLSRYVREGGTLLMPRGSLTETAAARLAGLSGEPVADGTGKALATAYALGKGRLIVSTSEWMTSGVGPDMWQKQLDMWRGRTTFPEIAYFLRRFRDELFPFAVKGGCLHGANRTKKGWWLWAFNNEGVVKFTDTFARTDPSKDQVITVDLKDVRAKRVVELVSGRTVEVADGTFSWTLPAGEVAVFEIAAESDCEVRK